MSDAFYDEIVDKATGAYKVLVNGEWRVSSSGKLTTIENPSKGQAAFQVQGAWRERQRRRAAGRGMAEDVGESRQRVALFALRSDALASLAARRLPPAAAAACTKDEVDAAYAGAHAAQAAWAKTPLHARCALLHKVAALMREHKAPMAHCLVKEIAKPAKDALTEVVRRLWARAGAPAGRKQRGAREPLERLQPTRACVWRAGALRGPHRLHRGGGHPHLERRRACAAAERGAERHNVSRGRLTPTPLMARPLFRVRRQAADLGLLSGHRAQQALPGLQGTPASPLAARLTTPRSERVFCAAAHASLALR
jgi:hypothetical protein